MKKITYSVFIFSLFVKLEFYERSDIKFLVESRKCGNEVGGYNTP